MNIADNFSDAVDPAMFGFVGMLWPTHNPCQIARFLNTKYGIEGRFQLDERAVENMHQRITQLDRGLLGRQL